MRNLISNVIKKIAEKIKEPMEFREKLADLEHERWANWMKHLFTKGIENPDGSFTINRDSVERWKRQIATKYEDLSESEKDSDRKEINKFLALMQEKTASFKLPENAPLGKILPYQQYRYMMTQRGWIMFDMGNPEDKKQMEEEKNELDSLKGR